MTFELPWDALVDCMLVSARVGALIMSVPAIGGEAIPVRIRAVFVIAVSAVLSFCVPHPRVTDHLFVGFAVELGVGLTLGLTIRVAFAAAELAGELIATQLGFGLEGSFNALSDQEAGTYTQLFSVIVGLTFFACGGHLELLRALAASIVHIPPGESAMSLLTPDHAIRAATRTIFRGLTVAAPLSVAVLAGQLTLGVVARIAPQLNAWSFGFMLTGAIALLGASLAAPSLVQQLAALVHASFADVAALAGG